MFNLSFVWFILDQIFNPIMVHWRMGLLLESKYWRYSSKKYCIPAHTMMQLKIVKIIASQDECCVERLSWYHPGGYLVKNLLLYIRLSSWDNGQWPVQISKYRIRLLLADLIHFPIHLCCWSHPSLLQNLPTFI